MEMRNNIVGISNILQQIACDIRKSDWFQSRENNKHKYFDIKFWFRSLWNEFQNKYKYSLQTKIIAHYLVFKEDAVEEALIDKGKVKENFLLVELLLSFGEAWV